MITRHTLLFADSRSLLGIPNDSIDLVVTSPPYPMISMWDNLFSGLSADAKKALASGAGKEDGAAAFEAMHRELDRVWAELYRVLKPGSFACINIGDAVRTIGGRFQLYPNHSRIMAAFRVLGFDCLPVVLWRKQTNAPNKFMGSGMLPSGAYVTLEHEYILIFRKGPKREFKTALEKARRMESSFFWEERNIWFSDVWDFKGASQGLKNADLRVRSAAFPIELPYRLIAMYSLYGDVVLDPFMGTGTTALAAIARGRSSVGVELDGTFRPFILEQEAVFAPAANRMIEERVKRHADFVSSREEAKKPLKYRNENHGFPVMTRQETGIRLYEATGVAQVSDTEVEAVYEPL